MLERLRQPWQVEALPRPARRGLSKLDSSVTGRVWLELIVLGALWGAVYILSGIGLRFLLPPQLVFARVSLAAVVLTPVAIRRHALGALWRSPRRITETVLVQVTIPMLLLTVGQLYVDTSLAGILGSAQPIFLALLAVPFAPDQRPNGWIGILGILLGFGGLALLFGFNLSVTIHSLLGGLLVLISAVSYAAGAIMIHRRHGDAQPIGVASSAMLVSAAVLALPAVLVRSRSAIDLSTLVPAVLLLGVLSTGAALALFYSLINHVGPARAALGFYLAPVFAVLFGVVFRHEPVTLSATTGLVAIVGGSVLAARRRGPGRRASDEPHLPVGGEPRSDRADR